MGAILRVLKSCCAPGARQLEQSSARVPLAAKLVMENRGTKSIVFHELVAAATRYISASGAPRRDGNHLSFRPGRRCGDAETSGSSGGDLFSLSMLPRFG